MLMVFQALVVVLLLLPAVGAIVVAGLGRGRAPLARQISLGVTVADGKSAIPRDCQWSESNGGVPAKSVFLEILGPMGKLTPVDRFNTAKAPLGKIVKTPVSGLGDDAVFVETLGVGLYVKKGNSVFLVRVSGFPLEDAKAKEKALAQQALAKL